jgi:hypothetical protein
MDEIVQLRKNVLSDWLDKALRKMEQVLTRPVNGIGAPTRAGGDWGQHGPEYPPENATHQHVTPPLDQIKPMKSGVEHII